MSKDALPDPTAYQSKINRHRFRLNPPDNPFYAEQWEGVYTADKIRAALAALAQPAWAVGGRAPVSGPYWVQWNFGTEPAGTMNGPRISEFHEGYEFAATTRWAGPLLPPGSASPQPEPAEDSVHGRCAFWLRNFIFKHKREPYPQEVWDAARSEVQELRDLLAFISLAETGGEIFPCGPAEIEYAGDGNTVVRYVGPWRFLDGEGKTFIDAVKAARALRQNPGTASASL